MSTTTTTPRRLASAIFAPTPDDQAVIFFSPCRHTPEGSENAVPQTSRRGHAICPSIGNFLKDEKGENV